MDKYVEERNNITHAEYLEIINNFLLKHKIVKEIFIKHGFLKEEDFFSSSVCALEQRILNRIDTTITDTARDWLRHVIYINLMASPAPPLSVDAFIEKFKI